MASEQEIQQKVQDLLRPLLKQGQTLTGETQLVGDLGLDSVQVMELLTQVEDGFDITIPLNLLPDIRSLDDLCVQIKRLLG